MADDFYRAFEDRYRGPRELIKQRLRAYLPFVEPLKALYADCTAVDLGCGRGEWLELMGEAGIGARGVDLDEGMLAACVQRGLNAEQGEAVAYLRALPDASVAVVSGFHVAEHIAFEALQQLVQQALRVLRPAGLLILETPNPENLSVGAAKFYYDPTHQRPIPPPLLSFLPEHYGFARAKVLRLQERPGLARQADVGLSEVLLGVSPDYAVVAQKGGEAPGDLARFDEAFATEFGVDLDTLATRYDSRIGGQLAAVLAHAERGAEVAAWAQAELAARGAEIERLHGHIGWQQGQWEQAKARLAEVEREAAQAREERAALGAELSARGAELEQRLQAVSGELHAVHQSSHHHWMLAEARQRQIDALRASWSWRITAPLRWAARPLMGSAAAAPSPGAVPVALRPLVAAMRRVLRDPQRSYRLNQRLLRHPRLHGWLVALARRAGIYPGGVAPAHAAARAAQADSGAPPSLPPAIEAGASGGPTHIEPAPGAELTPAARRIYRDLLAARAARRLG